MYRNGDSAVKSELEKAYADAQKRARDLHRVADKHVNDDNVYMGDFHILGRRYKKSHVVVPYDDDYVQSAETFLENQ
jgi:hypothetical protein